MSSSDRCRYDGYDSLWQRVFADAGSVGGSASNSLSRAGTTAHQASTARPIRTAVKESTEPDADRSMDTKLRVLLVEDSEDDALLLKRELKRGGYKLDSVRVWDAADMRAALASQTWDVVISDHRMPRFSAPEALAIVQESGLDTPFIIVSGADGEDFAVDAMKAGAHDYIKKDNMTRLVPAIEREVREALSRRERKHLEDRLRRQSQKLETVGRLAAGVAHDFNNVLTSILVHAHLATPAPGSEDSVLQDFREIQKAAQRAANLTHQLLAFSRDEAVEPAVLSLHDLFADLVKMLRRLIGEDIDLVTSQGPDVGRVKVDPGQMEQVIVNLAVNARDAMPQGGTLRIETPAVTVDGASVKSNRNIAPGEYALLAVSDTGAGMTVEVTEHIFEPFFTTKEEGKGTGLGLSTCHDIITENGGYVTVDSEPGRGTTFQIYLPRVHEAEIARPYETPSAGMLQGDETVLVVEDEDAVLDPAARVLDGQGYTVLTAPNGLDALRVAQEYGGDRIDLLLTDVVMPMMSGKELADRIRESRPEAKVLYTSGYYDTDLIYAIMSSPGTQFMRKPFTAESLAGRVREVLDMS